MGKFQYNTAIARLMELLTGLQGASQHHLEAVARLLQLVAPFAPFITQELWERLGFTGMICDAPWPSFDESLIVASTVEYVIQVNGRVRDRILMAPGRTQEEIEKASMDSNRIQQWTDGKELIRKIFVPDKLLNIVTKG